MNTIENLYQIFLQHPKVITDSRAIEKDCLFFALKGARFNGNKFAAAAIEDGAAYAIIDEAEYAISDRFILVENVLEALQKLAAFHRQRFYIPILGLTGSNGKTTTKELINAVLSSTYPTHCTKGNFNNHIGLPLTLLAMPQGTEVAVIEMGANHVGEIDFLCKIADPTHGLITNIGKAHLEGFGGIEGVKKGKSELYRYLENKNGVVFINKDESFLLELAGEKINPIIYYKSSTFDKNNPIYETVFVSANPFVKVVFSNHLGEKIEIQSHLIGDYNFQNIMTAIAVGRYFKVADHQIKEAIENYIPTNNRSQIIEKNSNTYVLDAYNANPTSIKNALESFAELKAKKKIVFLGDMLEMGVYSQSEHRAIYEQALSKNFDYLILVGKEFGELEVEENVLQFANVEEAKKWLEEQNFNDAYFLIKGSRGIKLEKLLRELEINKLPKF